MQYHIRKDAQYFVSSFIVARLISVQADWNSSRATQLCLAVVEPLPPSPIECNVTRRGLNLQHIVDIGKDTVWFQERKA